MMTPPDRSKGEGGMFVSERLAEMVEKASGMEEAALLQAIVEGFEKKEGSPAASSSNGSDNSEEKGITDADWQLLAEAIELYFEAVPEAGQEKGDDFNEDEREALRTLAAMIRDEYGPPAGRLPQVANIAPPGSLPWEILGVDEEHAGE